jgi:hypothetical protein
VRSRLRMFSSSSTTRILLAIDPSARVSGQCAGF